MTSGTREVEKPSSTSEVTKKVLIVPSAVLVHAAGNEKGAKCSLSRAAGRRLRTLFLDIVLNRRPVVVICVQKRHKVYASE